MAGPADWGAVPADKPAPSGDGPAAWGARPVEQEAAVPPPESSGISGVDPVQNWLPGIPGIDQGIEIAGGAAKGLASIPVGVGQLAENIPGVGGYLKKVGNLPGISQVASFAESPNQSWFETGGDLAGLLAGGELTGATKLAGLAGRAVSNPALRAAIEGATLGGTQATQTGSLGEHGEGALLGGVTGGVLGAAKTPLVRAAGRRMETDVARGAHQGEEATRVATENQAEADRVANQTQQARAGAASDLMRAHRAATTMNMQRVQHLSLPGQATRRFVENYLTDTGIDVPKNFDRSTPGTLRTAIGNGLNKVNAKFQFRPNQSYVQGIAQQAMKVRDNLSTEAAKNAWWDEAKGTGIFPEEIWKEVTTASKTRMGMSEPVPKDGQQFSDMLSSIRRRAHVIGRGADQTGGMGNDGRKIANALDAYAEHFETNSYGGTPEDIALRNRLRNAYRQNRYFSSAMRTSKGNMPTPTQLIGGHRSVMGASRFDQEVASPNAGGKRPGSGFLPELQDYEDQHRIKPPSEAALTREQEKIANIEPAAVKPAKEAKPAEPFKEPAAQPPNPLAQAAKHAAGYEVGTKLGHILTGSPHPLLLGLPLAHYFSRLGLSPGQQNSLIWLLNSRLVTHLPEIAAQAGPQQHQSPDIEPQ